MKLPKYLSTGLCVATLTLAVTGCEQVRVDAEVRALCAKDGGIKVYETVTLSTGDYAKYSKLEWRGLPHAKDLSETDEYYRDREQHYYHQPGSRDLAPLEMFRSRSTIVQRSDNKILGENVRYTRIGGDYGPAHPSHFTCPAPQGPGAPNLETSVFLAEK